MIHPAFPPEVVASGCCFVATRPRTSAGDDTFVLCEFNVSSVLPFPDARSNRWRAGWRV